jgi:prephenate dehydrogenase
LVLKELRQVTVLGLGLLGGSVALAALRSLPKVKVIGFSHRAETRERARRLGLATEICNDICEAVSRADIVILATPIGTFRETFVHINSSLPKGCIVTDVGSTKVLAHHWAQRELSSKVLYVGSHPVAGSEQRGLEFARDDLFAGANCILTATKKTNRKALNVLKHFWSSLGSRVVVMDPAKHDKILANISHLPHITAAALVNASPEADIKMAGRGFIDTSRVASGPANIWTDILLTNSKNICQGIDNLSRELSKLRKAIKGMDEKGIEKLLEKARSKRARLISYKLSKKEILS